MGMKLVSSREAVTFLSQMAPRAWVQRMLRCMVLDHELYVYFSSGRIQPHTRVMNLTFRYREEAGEFTGPAMDRIIEQMFLKPLAEKLIGKDGNDRVNDELIEWVSEEGHDAIDPGWLYFADEVDWENGSIKVRWVPTDRESGDLFFSSGEFFISEFDNADYEAEFFGMSFDYARIEMLIPNASLGSTSSDPRSALHPHSRVGRPPKWNWEGALAHVIARAQTPDGLPVGSGAQARIEEIIGEWFIDETGECPAPSQIRQRAATIMRSLEKPKRPEIGS